MLKVKTRTHIRIHISILTQIKIKTKIAWWEGTNICHLEEAKALALCKSKGLGTGACMAALANPGGDSVDKGRLHARGGQHLSCSLP